MMEVEKRTTKEILKDNLGRESPSEMQDLLIALHNVRSMYNVGAAFRNADAFGIRKILISGFTPAPPRAEITKTAIGAEKYVDWEQSENIDQSISELKTEGYHIIGMEQTDNSKLITDYNIEPDNKICILFGNEVTGLDKDVLHLVDTFLEIPQYGHKHSLNVSVTVGITLYAFLQKYWR